MKSQLEVLLLLHQIQYRWGFSFAISFMHQDEVSQTVKDLKLQIQSALQGFTASYYERFSTSLALNTLLCDGHFNKNLKQLSL